MSGAPMRARRFPYIPMARLSSTRALEAAHRIGAKDTMNLVKTMRHAAFPLYRSVARRLHELNYLYVELTTRCNLECLHCGSDCRTSSDVQELEAETVLRVLREIKTRYDSRRISVVLVGGEPLCYKGLFDLGAQITALEFPWGIVTNGWSWTPATMRRAKDAGLHSLSVSLDGLAESHDWLRDKRGSHQRALTAIEMLLADRFWLAMDVITCVNRRNLAELPQLYAELLRRGVPAWRLFTIAPIGRAPQNSDLFLVGDELVRLFELVRAWRQEGKLTVSMCESDYLGPTWDQSLALRDHFYFCRAGITIGGVMANGDILACPNIDRSLAQGNVYRDSFIDVWENRFKEYRERRWMRTGACATCKEWRYCEGNSLHLWDPQAKQTRLCHCQHYSLT
jgi:radical SAM protein with 4Fe4S-binding SPASM domain